MLRGSSRCVRGSHIARNIKPMVLRKLAEAIFKRKHSRKLRLWSRKLCGSPRGTWGLRQAVLKGINDTAQLWNKKLKANSCGIFLQFWCPWSWLFWLFPRHRTWSPGIWNRLMIYGNSLNQPFRILLPAKSWLFDVPTTISGDLQ